MADLTSKELTALEDQLNAEQNMIKKYKLYDGSTNDPQIKTRCEQIAAKHQNHFTRLMNQLG